MDETKTMVNEVPEVLGTPKKSINWFSYILIFLLGIIVGIVVMFALLLAEVNIPFISNTESPNTNDLIQNNIATKEETRLCDQKELQTKWEDLSLNNIEIYNNGGIYIVFPEYDDVDENVIPTCEIDITEDIKTALDIDDENIELIANLVVLSDNLISFNYSNSIYTYNIVTKDLREIISRKMFKGTELYSDDGIGVEIVGPFVNSYTQYGSFYFYTDVTWGCEETGSSYCLKMQRIMKELEKKKLLGMFEYDYVNNKKILLK